MILPLRIVAATGRFGLQVRDGLFTFLRHITYISTLSLRTLLRAPLFVRNIYLSTEQMYIIGLESLPLVAITSVFVGAEAVIQAEYQFAGFVPLKYLGLAVCKSLITELCPVLTSLVVSGRVATAIAAEVGSMKTSEQLDAMECLSLDPIRYLIVPKTLACMVMLPVLVVFSELVAFVGSIITALLFVDVTLHLYLTGLRMFFNPWDLYVGILKTVVFGIMIALTGAHFGLQARKGAEGVGEATTFSVMTAAVLILILDFVIAFLVLRSPF
ncbi:MAG: ABC transporter permease [Chitinivibrionales bacterium]|nr:ABC transporter permease [Chitinivibrionales bacterium]MBD3357423.1 ABC transporter permease [Chitinivibrionales bacterium]